METPLQTAERLLVSLEDLASKENVSLRHLDLVEAVDASERAAPLVRRLAELAAYPEVLTLRPQVAALIEQRQKSAALLDEHLARVQADLRRIDVARARLARLAPIYHSLAATGQSRLNTAA